MRFTKKLLAATIVLTMVFAMLPNMVMAQEANAAPSAHTVMVDGETVAFRVFLIDGNNFFMLRDIAYALSGSPSQFEVTWDADLGAINLLRGTAYTVVGGEMEPAAEAPEAALESTAVVYVDGIGVDLRAYNIGGNNFFMLRYLGDAVGFEVDWDPDEAVVLITSVAAEEPVQEPEEPADEDEPADEEAEEPADDEDAVDLSGFADFTPVPGAIERQLAMPQEGDLTAVLYTNMGEIHIRLFPQYAPLAVENFVTHARAGFYDGVIFHRVIQDFMNQTGDPEGTGAGGESIWGEPFGDEFSHNLRHVRGAVSMANAGPATNGSQFFIVQRVNQPETHLERIAGYLEYPDTESNRGWLASDIWPEGMLEWYLENGGTYHLDFNHTVFGQVFIGMDVVEAIEVVETGEADRPIEDVIIERIVVRYFQG